MSWMHSSLGTERTETPWTGSSTAGAGTSSMLPAHETRPLSSKTSCSQKRAARLSSCNTTTVATSSVRTSWRTSCRRRMSKRGDAARRDRVPEPLLDGRRSYNPGKHARQNHRAVVGEQDVFSSDHRGWLSPSAIAWRPCTVSGPYPVTVSDSPMMRSFSMAFMSAARYPRYPGALWLWAGEPGSAAEYYYGVRCVAGRQTVASVAASVASLGASAECRAALTLWSEPDCGCWGGPVLLGVERMVDPCWWRRVR